jgi:hypothetical protein
MSDIRDEIDERVRLFVGDLEELIRQAALEAVQEALGQETAAPAAAPAKRSRASGGGKRKSAGGKKKAASKRSSSAASRQKLIDELYEHVEKNPGAKMEEIRDALGAPTKVLRPLANRLLKEEVIRKEGERRATRYFPAGR